MPRSPNGRTSSRPTTFRRSTDEQTGFVMNEMSKPAAAIKGEDHWTTKDGDVKLFLFEKYAGDPAKTVGTILFVHGSSMASQPTFDLQVPGRPEFVGDGLLRPPRLRLLVRRHGGLRALHQGSRQQRADFIGRRRLLCGRALHPETARQATLPGLRHLLRRAARSDVRRAASGNGGAARPRRHGVDWRRLSDPRAAAQEATRIPGQEPPADRQGLRPFSLRPRPPWYSGAQGDRSICGRGHGPRQFGADRNLCRHVLEIAGGQSGKDQCPDIDHARPTGWYRVDGRLVRSFKQSFPTPTSNSR